MFSRNQLLGVMLFLLVAVSLVVWTSDAQAVEADEVWATAFEESPANNDSISAGAAKVRATRSNVRARLEVEHFIGGTAASEDDDNGHHRLGSARCYMTNAAPAGLFDSHSGINLITDLEDLNVSTPASNDGTLANIASGAAGEQEEDDIGHGRCWIDLDGADGETNNDCTASAAPSACCTALNTGTCNLDNNKMYIYLGIDGDGGSEDTGLPAGWEEVKAESDPNGSVGGQIHLTSNYVTNGDFEWNATDGGTACDSTTIPSEWTAVDGETFTYLQVDSEGEGCAVVITDINGADGISQVLNNLQANSSYRVTARVDAADASDVCTLTISGAATESEGVHTGVAIATIESTFTTTALADVTIALISTVAGDICTWDHVSVRRETRTIVPDAGIIAIFDTYTDSPGTAVEEEGTGFADVTDLSISFNPPTPGWIVQLGATVSIGCDSATCNIEADEGFACRLEKDGSVIPGTLINELGPTDATDYSTSVYLTAIDINPMVTTAVDIVYTVACREEDNGAGGTITLIYNYQDSSAGLGKSFSNLWMMAYPPH